MVDDYTNITSIGILRRFLEKRPKKGGSREIRVDKLNIQTMDWGKIGESAISTGISGAIGTGLGLLGSIGAGKRQRKAIEAQKNAQKELNEQATKLNFEYGVKVARMAESPVYMGGASYEIVFSEVVSNSKAGEDEPLGTLAGRGVETNKKGGRSLRIKCEEPSLIMALSSYVPRVDYSQGNKWWTRQLS